MVSIQTLTEFLGWSLAINVVLFMFAAFAVMLMRETIMKIHTAIFGLQKEDLLRQYFQYLAQYKTLIIVLNLTPYIALKVITL